MSTVTVILAADRSPSFPEPVYLSMVGGVRLLERIVTDAATWPTDEVVVVLGADAERVEAACDLARVSVLVDPEWQEGSASSIRAVLDLLSRDRNIERCVMARGDQPGIDAATVTELVSIAARTDAQAVLPKYRYARGWPVVLDASLWPVFLGLEGTVDVHDVITTHAHGIEEVWVDRLQPAVISSPSDLAGLRR
jgi:molybdenum cofactor cytidylyltransferase